jgi:aspartate aminotransferase
MERKASMFQRLERLQSDTILGLMAAYRADSHPHKVDLGVGVYRNERGETPIFDAVRRAEQAVLARQTTKTYVSASGNPGFNEAMQRLVLGEAHPALRAGRVCTIQSVGGCGALRLGAELVRMASPESAVHVSTPTWGNHVPLLTGCGLRLEHYPYLEPATGGVQFRAMRAALERLPAGSVVLLHASCHNPTGADLDQEQWSELLPLFKERQLLPFIDLAYQGLGQGVVEDAIGARMFAEHLPEVLVAVSCSKNFGLYKERTGALHVISDTPVAAEAVLSRLVRIARTLYSMPPDHGASIVEEILTHENLRSSWVQELADMRSLIQRLRAEAVKLLCQVCPERDFSFIARQRGMFSFLGITPEQVRELRARHHIYMTEDSRINVVGLQGERLEYFARALTQIVRA